MSTNQSEDGWGRVQALMYQILKQKRSLMPKMSQL